MTKLSIRQGQKNQQKQRNYQLTYAISGTVIFAAGVIAYFSSLSISSTQSFTNVAVAGGTNAGADLAVLGQKDGGFGWGDINQDGYLDLIVNTDNSLGTRILIADPTDPANPVYRDSTLTFCNHCATTIRDRTCIIADLNHDGYLDFIRNISNDGVEIFLNKGPGGAYHFGVGPGNLPNQRLENADFPTDINTEGIVALDFDNNGWLDLIIENHRYGIYAFKNSEDGTANFTRVSETITNLPTGGDVNNVGDYTAAVDADDDGDIDVVARKTGTNDFFDSDGDGSYSNAQDLGDSFNDDKGGVIFGDFDNDGDYDIYWTDSDINQIWLNDGANTFSPTATNSFNGEPWNSAGVTPDTENYHGCAVGDVNNDGKLDLFVTHTGGDNYLFINNTANGGPLNFTQNNLGISENGENFGASFADYDRDGDLDLYLNRSSGSVGNQLWRNDLNSSGNSNYTFIEPRINLGGGIWRSAVGANVVLKDCNGNTVSGVREVPTAGGRGTDAPDQVHFGLPNGPDSTYTAEVKFVTNNGTRTIIQKSFVPSTLSNHTLVVYDTESDDLDSCIDNLLPVEWLSFTAFSSIEGVQLEWITGYEINSDFYEIQRSIDGQIYKNIALEEAAGNTIESNTYTFLDRNIISDPSEEIYYRIRQVDIDGTFEYSQVVSVILPEKIRDFDFRLYPNPASDRTTIDIRTSSTNNISIKVTSLNGTTIWNQTTEERKVTIPVYDWIKGNYIIQVTIDEKIKTKQLLVQ